MNRCWQSGFDSALNMRKTMHHWRQLQNILSQGANREAAAIVKSFQVQMDLESDQRELYELHQLEQRLAS